MQVELVADLLLKLRSDNIKTIEPRRAAEEQWRSLILDMNEQTLFPLCDSWYMGANIPGKKREQLNYVGGIPAYFSSCRDGLKDWNSFDIISDIDCS
jgi:hypothetical protein